MKRLVEQLDGVLTRQAAALADEVRAGFRASLNPNEIVKLWNETHRDSVEVTPNQARDWAVNNLRPNSSKLSDALDKVYGVGGALGYDASLHAYAKAKLSKAIDPADITNAINIDWSSWKPGSRAAAMIAAPRGGFARLLNKKTSLLQNLDTTTLRQVGTALSAGLAVGATDEMIASKLRDVIESPGRALIIATTEMNSAMSIASMDNYEALGVEKVEWLGLEPCEICEANIEQGPIPYGEEFDSGDTEPPGHTNCRCSILPVIEGLDDNALPTEDALPSEDSLPIEDVAPVEDVLPPTENLPTAAEVATAIERPNLQTATDDEYSAVRMWQSQNYKEFNLEVRAEQLKPDTARYEDYKNLLSLIDRSPLKQDETLYRGFTGTWAREISKLQAGDVFTDKGFIATSANKNVARDFARQDDAVILKIEAESGTKVLSIDEFNNEISTLSAPTEQEFVFAPNTNFEIVSIEPTDTRITNVTVKVVK